MFKNYLKIAWRNLVRNKIYSSVNIIGLAIALAVCMMILFYVEHETSYDKFHENAERIYWIQGKVKMGNDSVFVPNMSYATAPLTKSAVPFVESFVRLRKANKAIVQNLQSPSLKFQEDNFLFADSNFFSFFSFRLLKGSKQQVLQKPFTVVISKQAAEKYFGNTDPVGKIIRYNNDYDFMITGVAERVPSNSSIEYDFVASLSSLSSMKGQKEMITSSQTVQLGAFSTYFLLKQPTDAARLETALEKLNRQATEGEPNERYIATPLISTHLKANYGDSSGTKYLSVFPFVAALILLLALTNYISLSTARSSIRAKEIGVRKVMGADRKTIAKQFFIESAMFTAIAFIVGYVLCVTFEPFFFNFLEIKIDRSFLYQPSILLSLLLLFIVTVLLAGIYPSILLSAYKPVVVLYGKLSKQKGSITVRKFFTVFQFTISVTLIICGIVISEQMEFFRHTNTGVNRENVLMIPFTPSIGKHYAAFKEEAASLPAVQEVSTARYPMYKGYDIFFTQTKVNTEVLLHVFSVDENFIPLLGLEWKRRPADTMYYDKQNAIVVNEAALQKLNIEGDPIGSKVELGKGRYEVAGVLKNFNYSSLKNKIDALCMFIAPDTSSAWGDMGGCFFAKLNRNTDIPSAITRLKAIYNKYDNEKPFEYSFMDDAFDAMYKAEIKLSKILNTFTSFTLLIACLGLFGLATFSAEQRTKEIGIRKVLGANLKSIVTLLSKEFARLVVIAIIIGAPIGWWLMNKWLEDFAYRINFAWWIFLAAGLLALVTALFTISFHAIKAATANPVKSLRTE